MCWDITYPPTSSKKKKEKTDNFFLMVHFTSKDSLTYS